MAAIKELKKIQSIYRDLENLRKEIQGISEDSLQKIDEAEKELEALKAQLKEKELNYRRLLDEIESLEAKINEERERAEKESLKHKDLQAIQKDIESRTRRANDLKKGAEIINEEISDLKKKIDELEKKAGVIRSKASIALEKREEVQQKIKEKETELVGLLNALPGEVRELIERLEQRYQSDIICSLEVEEGVEQKFFCSGCFIELSKSEVDSLKRERSRIHTCPYCGRIIHFSRQNG